MVATESRCTRSESLDGFPSGYGFSFGSTMCFSLESTFVFLLQSLRLCLSFGSMVYLSSFGFAYTVIRERRGVLCTKGQGGVVARKSVSHHHRQSAWQTIELQRVYGDKGMMEADWVTGTYGDTGVAEMDEVTGGIYSGDSGVDSLHRILYLVSYHLISSHLIIQRITHSIFRIF
jgi:hypothetical protein